jgi:UDP-GlcNAc3NAcA epimerase
MRIVSIVGARPQFVKAAMICRAVPAFGDRIDHRLIHTGQHYDAAMSAVFFEELHIPAPDHHLEVGSGSHGQQTGEMLKRLEPALLEDRPDWVLLYGDTNSTLAGAVIASKMGTRVAHVEAGLRSYNRAMPEELNRIVADHLSDLLLCPTSAAMENLAKEGLQARAIMTGDVMYDAAIAFRRLAEARGGPLAERWQPRSFALATIHRAENTDRPERLSAILSALDRIAAERCPVVLPLHPRTAAKLRETGWTPRALTIMEPVSYLEMLLLEGRARFILTDSGGVQKEAYFAKVPCITMRDETEWVETLANRCNVLTGAAEDRIVDAATATENAGPWTDLYGDGAAGEAILRALLERT